MSFRAKSAGRARRRYGWLRRRRFGPPGVDAGRPRRSFDLVAESERAQHRLRGRRIGRLLSPGTRTPAPQPLQRIFWPAISGFVANFRRHDGHRNFNCRGGGAGSSMVSIGAGTISDLPHPSHEIL